MELAASIKVHVLWVNDSDSVGYFTHIFFSDNQPVTVMCLILTLGTKRLGTCVIV